MVVSLRVLLINEVGVVGTYQLNAILLCKFYEHTVCLLLKREGLSVSHNTWICYLMALQLKVIVIAPDAVIPFDSLTSALNVTLDNLLRHFATNTGRADNEVFVESSKILAVSSRTTVISIYPRTRHEADKILISVEVLGKNDEVITTEVTIRLHHILLVMVRYIHLAAKDRFEGFLAISLELFVYTITIIEKFLYTEHISMVGNGNTLHPVGNSLIDEFADGRLSVKYGIIRVNV